MSLNSQVQQSLSVVVLDNATDELRRRAETFLSKLDLPFFSDLSGAQSTYTLVYGDGDVQLCQSGKGAAGPISASFITGKNRHRMRHGGGNGQLIAKAVGLKKGLRPHVLDVTAGLGRDAFVLATLGCRVDMFERVPVVEELLLNALSSARECDDGDVREAVQRMTLHSGDAIEYLRSSKGAMADVIYLDPMYPDQGKSAAVKKEMRAFHDLVGNNSDDHELLASALEKARYRVVVKRPRKGAKIDGPKPSLEVEGKSSRYDVYTLRRLEDLALNSGTSGDQ